jgi:hypothetical protein
MATYNGMTFDETVAEMTRKYDGYHFSDHLDIGMFNPFSVLNALTAKKFENYWFQTGTPTYLVDILQKSHYDLHLLINGVELRSSAFAEYRADAKNPIPMIYQSGYLTIQGYDKELDLYTLGFPNDEVRYGFLYFLLPYYTSVTDDASGFHIAKFYKEIQAGEVDAFMERTKVFFADIPYKLNSQTEQHYQVVFYLIFKLMGQYIETEVRSALGRSDAVVKTKDIIYVFEFKLNGTAEEALKQIDEKGYTIPYQADGRKIVKIGVEFSKKTRNVHRWLVS